MNLISGTFSTELRWPTMPTLIAPAALPMKADILDVAAGGDQRRRDGQERVAGADRVDDGLGEGGNARDARLRREWVAAERAMGDDDVVAIDPAVQPFSITAAMSPNLSLAASRASGASMQM